MQKRYDIMISNNNIKNKDDEIKCSLMALWCSSLLDDNVYNILWKQNFNKDRLKFIFENILNYVINFNDKWSKSIIQTILKKSKQFKIKNNIPIIEHINSLQNFIEPLMRNVKSDKSVKELINIRLKAQQKFDNIDSTLRKKIEEIKNEEHDDEDDEDDDIAISNKIYQNKQDNNNINNSNLMIVNFYQLDIRYCLLCKKYLINIKCVNYLIYVHLIVGLMIIFS